MAALRFPKACRMNREVSRSGSPLAFPSLAITVEGTLSLCSDVQIGSFFLHRVYYIFSFIEHQNKQVASCFRRAYFDAAKWK